jgi:hypothetical protein
LERPLAEVLHIVDRVGSAMRMLRKAVASRYVGPTSVDCSPLRSRSIELRCTCSLLGTSIENSISPISNLQVEVAIRDVSPLVHHLHYQVSVHSIRSHSVAIASTSLVVSVGTNSEVDTVSSSIRVRGLSFLHSDTASCPVDALVSGTGRATCHLSLTNGCSTCAVSPR